jgi:hypothetical protein
MKNNITKTVTAITCLLCMMTPLAHAFSWPEFIPPDKQFFAVSGYLDTTSCPPGQARLISNSIINIHEHFCRTFCPKTWNWIIADDNNCHDLATDFEFQRHEINHYSGNEDETSYSKITAFYGNKMAASPAFKIEMTTEVDNHWYCMETRSDQHGIICANDT